MIRFDQNGSLLAVQAADHTIECYEMFSTETMELRRKKRLKRLKKKQKEDSEPVDSAPYSIKDEFLQKFVMYATAKIKYFDFHPTAKQVL